MDLKDNRSIPVTDEQVNAFKTWVKERYGGREEFQIELRNKNRGVLEYYFVYNIFSKELADVFEQSTPYVDVVSVQPDILLLQLYRRRLDIKISRTSTDLIKRAFPREEDDKPVSHSLKLQRHITQLKFEHYWQFQGRVLRYTILHKPTPTEVCSFIPIVCGICLTPHTMLDTCVTKCGHEFGAKCLREWDFKTCPTCSNFYHEVTEFVA
jgi:hypothetical protein